MICNCDLIVTNCDVHNLTKKEKEKMIKEGKFASWYICIIISQIHTHIHPHVHTHTQSGQENDNLQKK